MNAFRRGSGNFGGLGPPAGHANLRRAIDDRSDAGGRALRRDVEGGPGMLGFELLGELRHEFRAESIGAFDDELLSERFGGGESEREGGQEMSEFHSCFIVGGTGAAR